MSDLMNTQPKIGQELLDVPFGEMIKEMAFAIAEAQTKLDHNSIEVAEMMGGLETVKEIINGVETVTFYDSRVFFGKETKSLTDAISIHNSSNDYGYKLTIRQNIGVENTNWKFNNVKTVTSAPTTAPSVPDENKIHKFGDLYYKWESGSWVNKLTPDFTIEAMGSNTNLTYTIPSKLSMLELGFSPTFYQFVDTIIEVKISIKYSQEGSQTTNVDNSFSAMQGQHSGLRGLLFGGRRNKVVTTSHVNATYSQKYNYSAEGSSLIRTKLVPIPPPAILEERIRKQMQEIVPNNTSTT